MADFFPRPRIARTGPGSYQLDLPDEEQAVLRSLVPQLRELLTMDDPSLRRLFPTAYPNDVERDREYQQLVRDELLSSRMEALDVVEKTIDADHLDAEELGGWMEAVNSLRLVLGTRLDVSEEIPDLDPDDPESGAYAIYDYLGWLLEQAVHAISEDLEPPT